jgi:hypothetical protein
MTITIIVIVNIIVIIVVIIIIGMGRTFAIRCCILLNACTTHGLTYANENRETIIDLSDIEMHMKAITYVRRNDHCTDVSSLNLTFVDRIVMRHEDVTTTNVDVEDEHAQSS